MPPVLDTPTLKYLIDHLFFPPHIDPSELVEYGIHTSQSELNLLSFVRDAICDAGFQSHNIIPPERMSPAVKMLETMAELQALPPGSDELQSMFLKVFTGMREGDIVSYHVKVHNAGIIFRHRGAAVIFSSFEVSPENAQVLGALGHLQCSYPGTIVSIPATVFFQSGFLEQLTALLSSLSAAIQLTQKPTSKAVKSWGERTYPYRLHDPVAPVYITEFLTSILRGIAIGDVKLDTLDGSQIFKRIGDDVLLIDGEGQQAMKRNIDGVSLHSSRYVNVWRRSPLWLVIRVSLQTCFLSSTSTTETPQLNSHWEYKFLTLIVLTNLLEVAITSTRGQVSCERLSHMSRKVTNRVAKLEAKLQEASSTIPISYLEYVSKAILETLNILEKRWEQARIEIEKKMKIKWPQNGEVDAVRDTSLAMNGGQKYIQGPLQAYHEGYNASSAKAPVLSLSDILQTDLKTATLLTHVSSISEILGCIKHIDDRRSWKNLPVIQHIELWVGTMLEDYVSTCISGGHDIQEKACQEIYDLLCFYTKEQSDTYNMWSSDPEYFSPVAKSVEILGALELWMAIDRLTIAIIPLMKEYRCDLNPEFTKALLLPTNAQMRRLHTVETYLKLRSSQATRPSIFQQYKDINNEITMPNFDTFAACYFDQSPSHQELLKTIIRDIKGNVESGELRQAKVKGIIFELNPPDAFRVWRDATYRASKGFEEVRSSTENTPIYRKAKMQMKLEPTLSKYDKGKYARALLSCHIRTPNIDTRKPEVVKVIKNINWDTIQCRYLVRSDVLPYFSPNSQQIDHGFRVDFGGLVPTGSFHTCSWGYPDLEFKLYGHSSILHNVRENGVLGPGRWMCPVDWSLHEYVGLTILRDPECFKLRWLNILRGVSTGNIYLNRLEVLYQFLHSAWETGPQGVSTTHLRETHEIFHDIDFCNQILDALQNTLAGIQESWLQIYSMYLVIALALRVLALCQGHQINIKTKAAYLLRLCRATCIDWLRDLRQRSPSDLICGGFRRRRDRIYLIAVTCRQTFDTDLADLFTVFKYERDVGDFIECAISINEYSDFFESIDDSGGFDSNFLDFLRARDKTLAHRMETHLHDLVLASSSNSWFHSAIARIVLDHPLQSWGKWEVLTAPNHSWISTKPMSPESKNSNYVYYNLLDGALRIGASQTLGIKLPSEYIICYDRNLFENEIIVVKTTMPGMDFQTAIPILASRPHLMFYFGKRNNEGVIQVESDVTLYEIIPREKLRGDFPEFMLTSYLHLLNLKERQLEFRQLAGDGTSHWDPSNCHWIITISEWTKNSWSAEGWSITRDLKLIDYHSLTHSGVARIFESIEEKKYIQLTFCPNSNKILVNLTRYGLEFEIDGTKFSASTPITCRTISGMAVDRVSQDIGTLYGLESYLVLREATFPLTSTHAHRVVIIPQGEIKYTAREYSSSVRIQPHDPGTHIKYHLYSIDTLLGCLVPHAGATSLLYKSYLHALTSRCLSDSLTGLTGAQQALEDLHSACVWSTYCNHGSEYHSTQKIDEIYKLTPHRKYFSTRPSVQMITHRNPKLFCRYAEFYLVIKSIHSQWELRDNMKSRSFRVKSMNMFNDADHLQKRASIREAAYLAHEQSSSSATTEDTIYLNRGFSNPKLAKRVYYISRAIGQWTARLEPDPTPLGHASLCEKIYYHNKLHQVSIKEHWCQLLEFCQNYSRERDKYRLLFVLSAFAYSDEQRILTVVLETLLAVATNPASFSSVPLPIDHLTVEAQLNILRNSHKGPSPLHIPAMFEGEPYNAIELHQLPQPTMNRVSRRRGLQQLLQIKPAPTPIAPPRSQMTLILNRDSKGEVSDLDQLRVLFQKFPTITPEFHQRYLKDLKRSMEALEDKELHLEKVNHTLPSIDDMKLDLQQCLNHMQIMFSQITRTLIPEANELTIENLLYRTGLQQRVSPKSILAQLQAMNRETLDSMLGWKRSIVLFGQSITRYQRAVRLLRALEQRNKDQFMKEWENPGHATWDPMEFPEWLLFEIENNLLIRPIQAHIAREMIESQHNSTMQLNMGEGKSSVIIPIVAATLANRRTLVRVVILRSMWHQMLDLLTQRMGGLLNRRVYTIEMSRELEDSVGDVGVTLRGIFQECMSYGGIFLTPPEHVLSLKLLGAHMLCSPQSMYSRDVNFRDELLKTHHWLDQNARDIFDESDDLLHPRYELIYTTGAQMPLELGVERWAIIQEIFGLVRKYMRQLKKDHPLAIELIERDKAPDSFPFVRLLDKAADEILLRNIASEVIKSHFEEWQQKQASDQNQIHDLVNYTVLGDSAPVATPLKFLKGLLTIDYGIIPFVLREKRWRIDYGLRVEDTKAAVPYQAKGIPVPKAEVAHPDVRIALTCLSYYYEGLTSEQLRLCFRHLQKFRDTNEIYLSWIKECKTFLPPHLTHFSGVKLEEIEQYLHVLHPLVKLSKTIIDFYLSVEVFPTECKESPTKLSTSAWDLAETKTNPTTGFSGTNDSRYLLPLSIEQLDLNSQLHTNAKVLGLLLRPENGTYVCPKADGSRLSGPELLNRIGCILGRKIQVLIDVGAQVVDLDNEGVARYWLSVSSRYPKTDWIAAFFFNTKGEPTIVGTDGKTQPFKSSPYVENMERCLVYLDEAHTRGTDIKLPLNSVAVVTLGPRMTKDKLVQACMRMRKLGNGHSVCFIAPPEVHQSILRLSTKVPDNEFTSSSSNTKITTVNILCWVMHETCIQTQQNIALWAAQGISYQVRASVWNLESKIDYTKFAAAWQTSNSKSLAEMYCTSKEVPNSLIRIIDQKLHDGALSGRAKELRAIRDRCEEHQFGSIGTTSYEEQLEREVSRVKEKNTPPIPPEVEACDNRVSESLVMFIETGVPPKLPGVQGSPFCTLAKSLGGTSFGNQAEEGFWSSRVIATIDFAFSVAIDQPESPNFTTDAHLRPVSWIMSTGCLQNGTDNSLTLILLSSFEANELLPNIRRSRYVNLHMYSARIQKSSATFFDLTSRAIPPILNKSEWRSKYPESDDLMVQVGLYSGALYFSNYEIYRRTRAFLETSVEAGGSVYQSGEVSSKKLWEFLTSLIKARSGGMDIERSHIDYLLRGKILGATEWEELEGDQDCSGDEEMDEEMDQEMNDTDENDAELVD